MTTLVLAIGFQSIGEPRFAIDICSTIWRAVHNVPQQRMGNLPAVFGICERSKGRLKGSDSDRDRCCEQS